MSIEEKIAEIKRIMKEFGKLIEESNSEEEADEIYDTIYKLDREIAMKIWDDFVDWNKVSWIPEEAKKG